MHYGAGQRRAETAWSQGASQAFTQSMASPPSLPQRHQQNAARLSFSQGDAHLAVPLSQSQSQPTRTNPLATIARQKARYARGYVPPPALQHSQLQLLLTDTETQQESVRRPAWKGSQTQPVFAETQRLSVPHAPPHGRMNARALAPGVPAAPSADGWGERSMAVQEQQLACLQQLFQSHQQLAFHVQCLRDEVRGVRHCLAQMNEVPPSRERARETTTPPPPPCDTAVTETATPAASRKRPRTHEDAASRDEPCARAGAAEKAGTRAGMSRGPLSAGATADAEAHRMKLHSIKLIGDSVTSTQAYLRDDGSGDGAAYQQERSANSSGGGGNGEHSASDAADSEKDLFLL